MEGDCEECSTVEETIYWTHFQSIHFCQILPSDFRSQLMIPKKFCDYARGRLQDKVTLKGPSGTTTWEVGVTTSSDMLFLRDGWSEFVKAFSLEENDILIFKYTGNSSFSILIFDRESLCEKESSYFIKKCSHSKPRNRNNEKGFLKEVLVEFAQEYPHDECELTPSKKLRKDADEQNQSPSEYCIAADVPEMSHMKAPYIDVEAIKDRLVNQQKSWSWDPLELPAVIGKQKSSLEFPSIATYGSIRVVNEQQKEATVHRARKELTADSFLVVMRPSHVSRSFYLSIPAAWMSRHLTFKSQLVRLRTIIGKTVKTWPTKLQCRPNGRAGLSLGWKAFAVDNCLEECDVCVFKPASLKYELVTLDVSILRVVPDAVKSTQVCPASTQFSEVGMA